jgi:hypothetical protein
MRFQPIFRRDRVRSKIRITQHVPFDRNERDALFRGTELSKLRLMRLHELPAKDHRPKIHFINPLERLNGEIKRRTDFVGIFPNEAPRSPSRSVRCCSNKMTNGRRSAAAYTSLETIVPLSYDPLSSHPPWLDQLGVAGDTTASSFLHHATGRDRPEL